MAQAFGSDAPILLTRMPDEGASDPGWIHERIVANNWETWDENRVQAQYELSPWRRTCSRLWHEVGGLMFPEKLRFPKRERHRRQLVRWTHKVKGTSASPYMAFPSAASAETMMRWWPVETLNRGLLVMATAKSTTAISNPSRCHWYSEAWHQLLSPAKNICIAIETRVDWMRE